MDLERIAQTVLSMDLGATAILFATLLVLRAVAGRAIRHRTDAPPHVQRRWTANLRNALLLVGLLGIVLIWAPQLRTLALSLTAVAVAIVVATKELILCLSGALLRASSRAFEVGDWIEVGGLRGEVIDHTLLATKLQEFGEAPDAFAPTGRVAVVPNSLFLGSPVRNQTSFRREITHRFAITLEPGAATIARHDEIEAIVRTHHAPQGASDPLIRIRTTDLAKHRIEIALRCPPGEVGRLENRITLAILERLHPEAPAGARVEGVP
jgi:small-conductance mechanosensitive channel